MYYLQSDKFFLKKICEYFNFINIPVNAVEYESNYCDICFLKNIEDIPAGFFPECKYLIINSDDKDILKYINISECKIITCGMSIRSTVTLSSIDEKSGMFCLQRSIKTLGSKKISPFEIPFELKEKNIDEISVLFLVTAAIICGVNYKLYKKFLI